MSTAATIINHTRRHLLSGTVEERDKLATTVTSGATDIALTYMPSGFRESTVFEIGSELCYVWAANTGTKTLTVERGYGGTTPAAHTAGDIVTLNPRFPRAHMLDAINNELDDLSAGTGIFAEVEVALTYNGASRQINLTSATNVLNLLEVRYRNSATDWIRLPHTYLQRGLPTTDFASGFAVTFTEIPPNGTLRAIYSKQFVHVTTETDNMQTVALLPATCEDIVEYGVAIQLMAGREIKRTFIEAQGETRRADEVPSGATNQSVSPLRAKYRDRIRAEGERLARRYPHYNRR